MASKDLHHNVEQVIALNGQTINTATTTVGNIIDTFNYYALEFVIRMDAHSSGTATALLQDGDDPALGDAALVNSDFILDSLPVLNAANTNARVGYVGKKRYVRLSIVTTGSNNFYIGSDALLGVPNQAATPE